MMVTGLFATAILIARLFPDTPTGKWLHRALVESPLDLAARMERRHILFALILLCSGQALLLAAPIDAALIYALDLSLYLDAGIAVTVGASMVRAKAAGAAIKVRLEKLMGLIVPPSFRTNRRRAGRIPGAARERRPPANDDRPHRARSVVNPASIRVACTAAVLPFLVAAAPVPPEPTSSLPLAIGTSYRLPSTTGAGAREIPGREIPGREINVWLPPSYAKGTRAYPVLYVVDGGAAQDFHHISGLAQLATINFAFDDLIVVGIATVGRSRELTAPVTDARFKSWPQATGGAADFRRHIAGDVIPFIDGRYRTTGRRALIGESLAGLFVLETFLKSPALFTDYVSVSPSLWWDGGALSRQAPALLRAHDGAKRRLYLTMADEGGTMQAGLDRVLAALRAAPPRGLALTYVDRRATDTHATIYHPAALDALRKLFPVPLVHYNSDPWYMREGGQPPR